MPWDTFQKSTTPNTTKTLVPDAYAEAQTVTVPATTGGIELVPASTNAWDVRFLNIAVESKADTNGNPISIFTGVGIIPTTALYSNEILSGYQAQDVPINGQAITAICEAGQTLKVNVQVAPSKVLNL